VPLSKLYLPPEEGGLGLIDVRAKCHALYLNWSFCLKNSRVLYDKVDKEMVIRVPNSESTRHASTTLKFGVYSPVVTRIVLSAGRHPTDERTRFENFGIFAFSILTGDIKSDEDHAV
jgi:hypothetical protein